MKIEVETRFLDIDKAALISKLKALKAVDYGEVKLDEVIFYDKDLKWLEEHRLVKLRKKGDKISLTYKQNKSQQVDSTKEIEFNVSSMEEAGSFLKGAGVSRLQDDRKAQAFFHARRCDLGHRYLAKDPDLCRAGRRLGR